MPKQTNLDETGEWDHLSATVDVNKADLGFLEPHHAQLMAAREAAKAAMIRQDAFKSQLQQATRDLEKAMGDGREAATRVRNGIRAQYGLKAEKLAEFGLQPRRKPQKAKKQAKPAPTPGPVAQPAPEPVPHTPVETK
ncbi:MAG TPA: hypothetical protein VFC23_07640 [Thermoanaerobaculia bacterium]|nr:hypothetical protein [Thermoanaerobaculia bacterium]